jgi:hypothetical protein
MDPTFANPILNVSINATLLQPPQQWWASNTISTFVTAIVTIFAVYLGSYLGSIGEKNKQAKKKREKYFEDYRNCSFNFYETMLKTKTDAMDVLRAANELQYQINSGLVFLSMIKPTDSDFVKSAKDYSKNINELINKIEEMYLTNISQKEFEDKVATLKEFFAKNLLPYTKGSMTDPNTDTIKEIAEAIKGRCWWKFWK